MNIEESDSFFEIACERGFFDKIAEEYVLYCRELEEVKSNADGRSKCVKNKGRFPNVAGFCRYLSISEAEYECLKTKYPRELERIDAIFEDEALNSDLSPTIIAAYLKRRLGYDQKSRGEICDGQLRVVFDHDIMEDGE